MAEKKKRTRNKKEKKNKKGKNRVKHPLRLFVAVYVIALIALIIAIYFVPWISDEMAEVMTVEYGKLNESRDMTCYFVKNETVFYANANGKVGYLYAEGSPVRKGQPVIDVDAGVAVTDMKDYTLFDERVNDIYVNGNSYICAKNTDEKTSTLSALNEQLVMAEDDFQLNKINLAIAEVDSLKSGGSGSNGLNVALTDTGESVTYTSPCSGVVSYQLDGYESEFNKYTMHLLDKQKLAEFSTDSMNVYDGNATAGQPICKVTDDREWYAVSWISSGELSNYHEGARITLTLDGKEMKGDIYRIYERGSEIVLIMHFSSYFENIATLRVGNASITTSDNQGLVVKNSFIVQEDGVSGVYVLTVSGDTKFTPVRILDTRGEYSLVSSGTFVNDEGEIVNTVEVYDQIKKVKKRAFLGNDSAKDSGKESADESGKDSGKESADDSGKDAGKESADESAEDAGKESADESEEESGEKSADESGKESRDDSEKHSGN
ncbi:MAG: hypothetical protein IKD85_02510 [Firmicutes bacterium]|nr:hypothetical protein [Bacillota bacterium]